MKMRILRRRLALVAALVLASTANLAGTSVALDASSGAGSSNSGTEIGPSSEPPPPSTTLVPTATSLSPEPTDPTPPPATTPSSSEPVETPPPTRAPEPNTSVPEPAPTTEPPRTLEPTPEPPETPAPTPGPTPSETPAGTEELTPEPTPTSRETPGPTPEPSTTEPPAPLPTTPEPPTPEPPTPEPPTPEPPTQVPPAPEPPTPEPPTPQPPTTEPPTTEPPTPEPPTPEPPTPDPPAPEPPTPEPPTPDLPTPDPPAPEPPTPEPPTPDPPTTEPPTTEPPTPEPPTPEPPAPEPTTSEPTPTLAPPPPPDPTPTEPTPTSLAPDPTPTSPAPDPTPTTEPTPTTPVPDPTPTTEPTPTSPAPDPTPTTEPTPTSPAPDPTPTTEPTPTSPPPDPTPPTPPPDPTPTPEPPVTTPGPSTPPVEPIPSDSPSPGTSVPPSPSPTDPGSPSPPDVSTSDPPTPTPSPTEDPISPSPPTGGSLSDEPVVITVTPMPTVEPTPQALATDPVPTPPPPSPTSTPKRYERGDDIIIIDKELPNGTKVKVEIVIGPQQTPAVIVRGDSQTVDSADGVANEQRDRAFAFVSYISTSLAVLSLVMLLVLHFVAAHTPSAVASLTHPNQWELLAYLTYLQDMTSTAHYVVIAVPTYMWRFVDAFSWTSLIPVHGHDSGVGYRFLDKGRRLAGVVVLDGLVAFGDRIGVGEKQLLQTTVAGFLVGIGALFVAALGVTYYVNFVRDDDFDEPDDLPEYSDGEAHVLASQTVDIDGATKSRSPILVVIGTTVVFFAFSLYPITVMSFYEIASEIRARDTQSGSLTIALLSLIFVCGLFIVRVVASVRAAKQAREYEVGYRMVWGSLNSPDVVKYERRLQFVVGWLLMQIASALVISSVQSENWQLALLLTIDILLIVAVVFGRPFVDGNRLLPRVALVIAVIKALNTSLAFAFLSGSGLTSAARRRATASAFVILNAAIIALWFLRLVFLASGVVRAHMHSMRKSTAMSSALQSPVVDLRGSEARYVAMPRTARGTAQRKQPQPVARW